MFNLGELFQGYDIIGELVAPPLEYLIEPARTTLFGGSLSSTLTASHQAVVLTVSTQVPLELGQTLGDQLTVAVGEFSTTFDSDAAATVEAIENKIARIKIVWDI